MGKSTGHDRQPPDVRALQAAEAMQTRGERRSGAEAISCFEQAVALFQEAASGQLSADQLLTAQLGLAESLQQWADAKMEAARQLPDESLTPSVELEARLLATSLYERAVAAYHQVSPGAAAGLPAEAAVNCGNTLCSWAEALVPQPGEVGVHRRQCGLYEQAVELYQAALAQEADALTLANMGDALMQWAEASWQAEGGNAGAQLCQQALQCYDNACQMCDSSEGDDLAGLLCNWGSGLATAAQYQDPQSAEELLQQAVLRLSQAVEFGRGDPEPLVALGDALAALAALLLAPEAPGTGLQLGHSSPLPHSGGVGGGSGSDGSGCSPRLLQGQALLQRALAEGYGPALHLHRSHPQALVGSAEVQVLLARQADTHAAAAHHWQSAVQGFRTALAAPQLLGSFQDRCDVRYNLACALAQAGHTAEAAGLIKQLMACGGVESAAVAADTDLSGVAAELQLAQ
ncbi:hypothetical protein V8C86DRAFT_3135512 [Haematococcus lacustris]